MRNFFKYFSDKFLTKEKDRADFNAEAEQRQENINKMAKEGILVKAPNGKRYAVHKVKMSIYEILDEKDSFFRVKDKGGKVFWEEKSMFYADNIVYNTKGDFIDKEREKLLSLIDTSRYDVYIPITRGCLFSCPTAQTVEEKEKEDAEDLMKFIKAHTTADFGEGGCVFSNYILIGF